ncbi:unnamed protein product [Darwinula stevensoni]|uniref:Cytochrome c oxidase assembly protein COX16 homolog, mitochondrial n=1 Tax=Darwinula stevensoni TaxID=69355 RepID=A0A7R8XGT3_9CRUS|nr:unnamed protein product [Darwinula stevensoni]CAG0892047.1 unnamed protein product [Darwinula stevensoni]
MTRSIWKSPLFKHGLPFMILVLGGSFYLREFTDLRYRFRKQQQIHPEEMEKLGITMKKYGEVSLESEYEKMKKKVDVEHWENKRGPRPWEENPQSQK